MPSLTNTTPKKKGGVIRVGHSPDPDDAFMFYAIAHKKIDLGSYELKDVVLDIQTLNQMALKAELEVTAISVHTYAHVADRYAIMPCGASVGDRYGPILVSKKPIDAKDISKYRIAIPGELTTAYLALKVFEPRIKNVTVIPFDQIMPAVQKGLVDIGLVIHEGQLTYKAEGLHLIEDLGIWWNKETGLPLPLGIDAVRKDLDIKDQVKLTQILKDSILYALKHRQDALTYALKFGRGMDPKKADQFVGMYVNDLTVDCGEEVKKGIYELLKRGKDAGLFPNIPSIDFIELS